MTEINNYPLGAPTADDHLLFQALAGGLGSYHRVPIGSLPTAAQTAYVRTLFVAKHGSDSANTGTNPNNPLATLDAATTKADALSPTIDNRVAIQVVDHLAYEETVTQPDYTDLYAPMATLRGAITVGDSTATTISRIIGTANNQTLILKSSGDEESIVRANVIDGTGPAANAKAGLGPLTGVFNARNNASAGVLVVHGAQYYVGKNGDGVGDRSTGTGHIHVYADDIYNAGDGAIAVAGNITNSTIICYAGHIKDINGASGTAIRIGSSGDVYVITNQIVCATAYQINGSGNLRLICPDVQGSRIGNVTCEVADDRLVLQFPTSASGLPTGAVWRDASADNVLKGVP
jgi:hypothetical protein